MAARNAQRRAGCLRSGFTLVELLVVVSIICLMMSIMLPSLTRAQKQAEQVHCLANQHQLFLAWTLFSTNNDDLLCHRILSLKPYAGQDDVFVCVTANREHPHDISYGISNTMGGEYRDGVRPYTRLHKISQPSDSMVFIDIQHQGYHSGRFWPLLRDSEQKKWLWRPPDLFGLGGITYRHGNGCNMTFADGHGEMVRWKDERTLRLIRGTMADAVAASENNADLEYLVRVLVGGRPVQDETGD